MNRRRAIQAAVLALVLLGTLFMSACGVQKESASINHGDTYKVTLNKPDQEVKWESADTNVAVVNNGTITGVGPGTTVITAKSGDKPVAEITVTVNIVDITGIFLAQKEITMELGAEETLSYALVPENASDYGITWKSVNTGVAEVDSKGNITAVAPGFSTILCTAPGGSMATCEVTVKAPSAIDLLNEDEARFFNYLINTGLNSFYNASAVRLRNLYAITDPNVHAFWADIQGTNRLGGTVIKTYSVVLNNEGGGLLLECKNEVDKSVIFPADMIDYTKINAALEEHWSNSGLG